jgi:hypothetical protein
VAGAFAGDAALGFSLCWCRLAGDGKSDARVSRKESCGDQVCGCGVLWQKGAACSGRRSVVTRCGHAQGAVVRAVAAAAGGKVAVRVLRLCEQRRNGR